MLSSSHSPARIDGTQLAHALTEAIGGKVQTDPHGLGRYSVLGLTPTLAVCPKTEEEVARALEVASRVGAAVILRGGGTRMHLGNRPRAYDLALDLRGLDQVVEHQPADLTVTVQAGCTLAALQEALGREGQFLPNDPPRPDRATVGGILAVGWGGPLRAAYGPPRDWVIGMRAALPSGSVVKSGGKVVKNVTGYAMDRLFIGSTGTLGVILETTCKVLPLPRATRTIAASFASPTAALDATHGVRREGLTPMSAELVNDALLEGLGGPDALMPSVEEPWMLFLRAGGRQSTVDRLVDAFNRRCREAGAVWTEAVEGASEDQVWRALADAGHGDTPPALAFHLTGQPSQGAELVRWVHEMAKSCGLDEPSMAVSASYGGLSAFFRGEIRPTAVPVVATAVAKLREQTAPLRSQVIVERMPDAMRAETDAFGPPSEAFRITQGLKAEYDPQCTLSPGRFIGGI